MFLPREPMNLDRLNHHELRALLSDLRMVRTYMDSTIQLVKEHLDRRERKE